MTLAGANSLGQRFKPRHNGLTAVDLLLTAEAPNMPGNVELEILDAAGATLLRTARLAVASLPARQVWELRPGQAAEHWTTFGFEPIPDSAGRALMFRLRYSDAPDRPGFRVQTLAHFPSTYRTADWAPELLVNGFPQGGNLLFRVATAGTRAGALGVALENLARTQPIGTGSLLLPEALLGLCAVLAAAFVVTLWNSLEGPAGIRPAIHQEHDASPP
jgi:hypothetical protein